MKIIFYDTLEEFNTAEQKIHNHLKNTNPKYKADKWANPIIDQETGKYGLVVEKGGNLGQQAKGGLSFFDKFRGKVYTREEIHQFKGNID